MAAAEAAGAAAAQFAHEQSVHLQTSQLQEPVSLHLHMDAHPTAQPCAAVSAVEALAWLACAAYATGAIANTPAIIARTTKSVFVIFILYFSLC